MDVWCKLLEITHKTNWDNANWFNVITFTINQRKIDLKKLDFTFLSFSSFLSTLNLRHYFDNFIRVILLDKQNEIYWWNKLIKHFYCNKGNLSRTFTSHSSGCVSILITFLNDYRCLNGIKKSVIKYSNFQLMS